MNVWEDDRFDFLYADFTQHDQAIPLSLGMPAFEDFENDNVATFFGVWDQVETVSMPDFSGERDAAYVKWKNVSKCLGYI